MTSQTFEQNTGTRNYFEDINRAFCNFDVPIEQRATRLQQVVNEAKTNNVSVDELRQHLNMLGIQTSESTSIATQLHAENIKGYLDEITLQTQLALKGQYPPEKVQALVDEAVLKGIPKEMIKQRLAPLGVATIENQAQSPQSVTPVEITANDYNELMRRFNDTRTQLLARQDSATVSKLNGLPTGFLMNEPHNIGHGKRDPRARLAYSVVKNFLDNMGVA